MTARSPARPENARRSGPIQAPAMLIAGERKDLYSIQRGFRGEWVMANDTAQSKVGPYETWERVYEFFEFYKREAIYEVIDV